MKHDEFFMTKHNRSIINMLSGGLGYIIPMALNLLFTPIIISKLGNEAYGIQSLVNVIIGYLMLADMGLDIPVTKYIAEFREKEDRKTIYTLLNSTFQIYLLIGLTGMLGIFLLSNVFVQNVFRVPAEFHSDALAVFFLAGVGFLGGIFSMWGKSLFNGLQRYEIANGIGIISNFLSTVIGTVLVIYGYGVVWFVFVKVFLSLLSGIAYFLYTKRSFPGFRINLGIDKAIWELLKKQIGYGFILRISGILFSRMDQTLIGIWIGVAAVGIYSVPLMITTALIGLLASLTHFVFPMASALHSTNRMEELKSVFYNTNRFVTILSSMLFVPLLLFGDKFLTLWVGNEISQQASLVLILLTLATYSGAVTNLINTALIVGMGQLRLFTGYGIARGMIMALGCLLFIPKFKIAGAGMAMLASCLADYVFLTYAMKKFFHFSIYDLVAKAYFKPLILALLLGLGSIYLRQFADTWAGMVGVCALFIIVYVSIGMIINMFGETEKRAFQTLLSMIGSRNDAR